MTDWMKVKSRSGQTTLALLPVVAAVAGFLVAAVPRVAVGQTNLLGPDTIEDPEEKTAIWEFGRNVLELEGEHLAVTSLKDEDFHTPTEKKDLYLYHLKFDENSWERAEVERYDTVEGEWMTADHLPEVTNAAIRGDVLAAARRGTDVVHFFEWNEDAEQWRQRMSTMTKPVELVPKTAGSGNDFGKSISFVGDTLAVGAPEEQVIVNGTTVEEGGSVYVYHRRQSGWQRIRLQASDVEMECGDTAKNEPKDPKFGSSVALNRDGVLLAAAHRDDQDNVPNRGCVTDRGAVYVFERDSGGGGWNEVKKIHPQPARNDASGSFIFGNSLALNSTTALIGAHFYDDPMGDRTGAQGALSQWNRCSSGSGSFEHDVFISGVKHDAGHLGEEVAVEEEFAVVATNPWQWGNAKDSKVHLYRRASPCGDPSRNAYEFDQTLQEPGGGNFGAAVAIDRCRIAISKKGRKSDTSKVYVYRHDCPAFTDVPAGPIVIDRKDEQGSTFTVTGDAPDGKLKLELKGLEGWTTAPDVTERDGESRLEKEWEIDLQTTTDEVAIHTLEIGFQGSEVERTLERKIIVYPETPCSAVDCGPQSVCRRGLCLDRVSSGSADAGDDAVEEGESADTGTPAWKLDGGTESGASGGTGGGGGCSIGRPGRRGGFGGTWWFAVVVGLGAFVRRQRRSE